MHGSKKDLPVTTDDRKPFVLQHAEWGGMIVEIGTFPAGLDAAPFFKGLPDNMCQCPHWGFVAKGRVRMRYKHREEVFVAGDAYYVEPGHVPFYEEDSEVVEFSPREVYQRTLLLVARNVAGDHPPR